MQEVPFKAEKHRITEGLHQYIKYLLTLNNHSLKAISMFTGVCKNTVKAIDLERLLENIH